MQIANDEILHNAKKYVKQNIGIIFCIFHGIRYFGKVYRWNINETYKMNQNMQNGTISELYTDDNKSKYSRNPNHILKSVKNVYETLIIFLSQLKTFMKP